jgi:hypothetical protein
MAQADYIVANGTGAAVRSDLNGQLAAIVSNNSGATEPATMYAYQWWADTTAGLLKIRNAANNAWITLRELDGTLLMEDGTAAAPGLSFASDLDSGIFRGGANEFGIATNGVERVEFGTGEVVFNDGGANYDFRIEGDTNANLFFVDASAEAVGIGNTGPDAKLHITGGASFTGGEANLAVTSSTTASVPATISSLNSDATLQIFAGGLGSGGSRGGQIDLKGGAAATDAGAILFRTGTGTGGTSQTEKARLDASASGRLLVGTSSTSSSLPRLIVSGGADGGTTPAILVANTGATPTDGTALGVYDFSAANHSAAARIIARRDGGTWTAGSSQPTRLEFSTTRDSQSSPLERMRITNLGETAIGTTNNGLFVGTTQGAGTTYALFIGRRSITEGSAFTTGVDTFLVWSNGNVVNTNNSYGAISDIKLKKNIVDASSQWNDLKALKVRKYNFKEGPTHTQIGLVAQEVELVSPGLVSESPDRDEEGNDLGTVTKSVNYSVLYMKAVKALQEAMERIEALEADVAQLKGA